ncbi:glycerate kinase [Corynebacterium sp. Q4381]|uniref:glycerate kinase n=1 Tax=Corynebacterium sp. Marseille-Q4381 TaxID=3121597 RepID=UPI002FE50A69
MDSGTTQPRSPKVVIALQPASAAANTGGAAQWLGEGVREVIRDAEVTIAPLADGGAGTSELFEGERITLPTTDAAGRLTEATYTFDAASKTAFIDVAAASGTPAQTDKPVLLTGDTYGTGVLIADAQTRGAETIVLALGGCATADGGAGILVALGANPLDARGYQLPQGGGKLEQIADLDTAKVNIPAGAVEWVLLTGADNPTGGHVPEGDLEVIDRGLSKLCEVAGIDPASPGIAAAGGVPIGITWLSTLLHGDASHVRIVPGAQAVAEASGLAAALADASLVITSGAGVDAVAELASALNPGATVTTVPLSQSPDQLRQTGREAAVRYLSTSTVQG